MDNSEAPKESSAAEPNLYSKRSVVVVRKIKSRDPRFESGYVSDAERRLAEKRYGKIVREAEESRLDELRSRADSARQQGNSAEVREIQGQIEKIQNRQRSAQKKAEFARLKRKLIDEEKHAIASRGKRAFYISDAYVKREMRRQEFERLKSENKLEQTLAKRRQKLAHKERAFVGHLERHQRKVRS